MASHATGAAPTPPTRPPTYFTGRDDLGHTIALRQPTAREVLCGSCQARRAAEPADLLSPVGDVSALLAAELAAIAANTAADPLEDPAAVLYPGSGQPGHDCSDAFPGPVWLVHHDADAAGTDAAAVARTDVVDLYEALAQLPHTSRQSALEAHLAAMDDLYDHLLTAEAMLDGHAAEAYVDAACLVCLTDPDFHADELDAELTSRTLELAPVLRAYDVTVTLGRRRDPGPKTGPTTVAPRPETGDRP